MLEKKHYRMRLTWSPGLIATVALVFGGSGSAQTVTTTFQGTGRLIGGGKSWCYSLSPDGTLGVGDAVNADGKTVAVLFDFSVPSSAPIPIGFLDATNQESHGRGVGIDSLGNVHVSGWGKNSANNDQAFYWTGDRAGAGTFTAIPYLSGGNKSYAERLLVYNDMVYVAGRSNLTGNMGNYQAFRYNVSANSTLPIGYLRANTRSSALDIAWENETQIVGWSDSSWHGGSCNSSGPEAFKWNPDDPNDPYDNQMNGQKGLDWICGGEPWQISAGPDQIADTTAAANTSQVVPVGTSGMVEPNAIVVSAAPGNVLKDLLNPAGDDVEWPAAGSNCDSKSQSFARAISSNGRYQVGDSTFPSARNPLLSSDQLPRQAYLYDVHNRDYTSPDNCGGMGFAWPLGFAPGDNFSRALGVSNGGGYSRPAGRDGLTVVGWSRQLSWEIRAGANKVCDTAAQGDDVQLVAVGQPTAATTTPVVGVGPNGELDTPATTDDVSAHYWATSERAFVCFIKDDHAWGNDIWFLQQQDATETDPGASAASQFKDMKDLKAWLSSKGIDMTGWDSLTQATDVSDDGSVIVGFGIHNGVEEGFVATVQYAKPGACCVQTGWGSGSCTVIEETACTSGTWLGPNTSCSACDYCPTPFSDTDRDGDVDQQDFAVFQACLTGQGAGVPAGCECLDRSGGAADGDIDQDDWGAFESTATGSGIPWVGP